MNEFDFDFFEEGEPETINEPDDPEHVAFVKAIADEHGFPLSDWQPTLHQDETISIAPVQPAPKEKGLCENCGEREGKWHWLGESDASLAISHGWVQSYPWWCQVCCLKGKIEYATKQAAKIPAYEKELAEILDAEV